MKTLTKIFLISVFLLGASLSSIAQDGDSKKEVSEDIVESLLTGLNSDNIGLKGSSAYMLGDLRVTSAVIPLMRLLHNDENDKVRIAAALALYKIGTPMSIHAVKQASRFDDSERVSKLAHIFYSDYMREEFKKNNGQEQEKSFTYND